MRNELAVLLLSLANPAMALNVNRALLPLDRTPITAKVPPLRLGGPGWQPMTGPQISAAFRERTLILDETYSPYPNVKVSIFYLGGCPPVEHFGASGLWTRYECQRSARIYSGRWTIEQFRGGERLCVTAPDFPKLCRFAWRGANADNIFMPADTTPWKEPIDDPQTFNPYRLVMPVK